MGDLLRVLAFLDYHSGFIAAVGLILAAVGLLATVSQLRLFRSQVRSQAAEQERLAWDRILRLLHQVNAFAVRAHLSSATQGPHTNLVPPEVFAEYGSAQNSLLDYWYQLMVELSIMPPGTVHGQVDKLISKYQDAESRASLAFLNELREVIAVVTTKAQKTFDFLGRARSEAGWLNRQQAERGKERGRERGPLNPAVA